MRLSLPFVFGIAASAFLAGPAAANGDVSLNPLQTALEFTPHGPAVVAATHPLAGRVVVDPIVNVPARIGSFLNTFARAGEMNEALVRGVTDAGMLSTGPGAFRLTATWLAFDSPFKISLSSRASATIRYELRRIDSGTVIFQRDITTSTTTSGGNAAIRQRGTARATLAANFAGALWCLEQAAYDRAPADCAVSPVGSFDAPIVVPIFH